MRNRENFRHFEELTFFLCFSSVQSSSADFALSSATNHGIVESIHVKKEKKEKTIRDIPPGARPDTKDQPLAVPVPRGKGRKERRESQHNSTGYDEEEGLSSTLLSPPLCPILLSTPLSTSQMMTATTAATKMRKTIQKAQQTLARLAFLLFWRASQESLLRGSSQHNHSRVFAMRFRV